ncbi:bifunctional 3-(3-hydroxy-phenyl)propionate/3-hydroxycinnamic acid hydroxylase [Oricola nitratireducens]|uniref:bifunctional 3-(3-hydroxy-phenyl)propionate/3-hydroxycinnamic acid hydroxylase n=1 Tax=Oricola nitratireducens TaxID=2775868 RepID=UPI0018688CED|nr:bifunctional 3-(3-hydroxy-phenyl)propionate/3-hydroxycinnamic acid hydroxylase [Oricola nitratireducens]
MGEKAATLPEKTSVVIVGAGPVGLTIANYMGLSGVPTLVIEQREELIDYPRGVGMDDECLRSFQAIGLGETIAAHTTPDQKMRFLTEDGRIFASIEPKTREFGWPRRNSFIQPMIDKILFEGLSRYDCVTTAFGSDLVSYEDRGADVLLKVEKDGEIHHVAADWLVGCDGGRSIVRKTMGSSFDGITDSTRWVVIDLLDDPLGRPDSYFVCIPERPYVSIALPHGMRRLEFMVFGDETEEKLCSPEGIRALLSRVLPRPEDANVLRSRVYTHNARLAGEFRKGRVMIAGDAAHLMPVWQGQGYNSGIRDATNLSWKLALVAKGLAGGGLLDTYGQERRDHLKAMIDLSVTAGKIFSPTSRIVAWLRDRIALALNLIPPVKRYIFQMRFKPMPRFDEGVVLKDERGQIRGAATGKLFPQPAVIVPEGNRQMLDDALGPGFAILSWGSDPQLFLSEDGRARWKRLGARFFALVPDTQFANFTGNILPGTEILGDADGSLHEWFSSQGADGTIVFLRPDRIVAGIVPPQEATEAECLILDILGQTDG